MDSNQGKVFQYNFFMYKEILNWLEMNYSFIEWTIRKNILLVPSIWTD